MIAAFGQGNLPKAAELSHRIERRASYLHAPCEKCVMTYENEARARETGGPVSGLAKAKDEALLLSLNYPLRSIIAMIQASQISASTRSCTICTWVMSLQVAPAHRRFDRSLSHQRVSCWCQYPTMAEVISVPRPWSLTLNHWRTGHSDGAID